MSVAWQGVFPAATTQFQPDQSLDLPATMAHVDKMIDAGHPRADHAGHGRRELLARCMKRSSRSCVRRSSMSPGECRC